MPVSVGVIGAGGIGRVHAQNLHDDEGATVEAVCDVDAERAQSVASSVDARTVADFRELLRASNLDAVYVTTPPRERTEIVEEAARRGVAIFCEKPLAATISEGEAIVDAVETNDVSCMVGFCSRFSEPCLRMHDLVRDGDIGDPICLFSARAGWGVPDEENWRVDPDQACGITVESASHNIDVLRWLGGEIATASGETQNVSYPGLDHFDDNLVATVSFESGAIGYVQNSWTSRFDFLRHGVIGTEGTVVVEGNEWWRLDRLVHATEANPHTTTIEFDAETATDMGYRGETRAFLDAVEAGERPPVDAHDGLRALEVSHEILSS